MGIFKFFRKGDARKEKAGASPEMKRQEEITPPERQDTNEAKLAELYNKLANQMMSMIPGEWEEVYYLGEVEKGRSSWSSVFYFKASGHEEYIQSNSIPQIYQVPKSDYMKQWIELNNIMLEIYDSFRANGQEAWEQISFSFNKTGKFHAKFLYDSMHDKDGGQLIRELLWAKNTFGYEPKEGSGEKKVLDNYFSRK